MFGVAVLFGGLSLWFENEMYAIVCNVWAVGSLLSDKLDQLRDRG